MYNKIRVLSVLALLGALSACESVPTQEKPAELVLKPAAFSSLSGWQEDDFSQIAPAFAKTCARIMKAAPDKAFGSRPEFGTYADWQAICRDFAKTNTQDLRAFFETHFQPYMVSGDDEPMGLFTGYYEASLQGSRVRTARYNIPLHARPDDLVMVDLGAFRDELKGQRIAGRVEDGNLKPYETRGEIVVGDWPHNDKVLVWVDDAVDAFFVQIQGSGVVRMMDGSAMRIGYAGQNGHPYYAVGRELIKRGELDQESVSMQSIRDWLARHPDQADEIMNTNKSYVFFKELDGEGPVGGEAVALTAHRSLAIDRSLLPYGLPMWVDIDHPAEDQKAIRRMMIAQDTGGAIRGPVRGDVFWGYGTEAEAMAGIMKSQGRYWALLPRSAAPR